MKYFVFFIFLFLCMEVSIAYTEMVVHVDETGRSLVFGESDQALVLPEGVELIDGRIQGVSDSLTSKSDTTWTFFLEAAPAEIQVFLPSGAAITYIKSGEAFIEDYSFKESRLVVYGKDRVVVSYTLGESDERYFLFAVLGGLVFFLVAAGGVAYFFWNKVSYERMKRKELVGKENLKQKTLLLSALLHEREQLILDIVKKHGKIKSSYARRESGIAKASFFRHLISLEKKGLIKRTGIGRNKFLEAASHA